MTSVLTRQKRDHTELDRLLHEIEATSGADRQDALNRLCRLVFPHAFAEESVLWPVVRRVLPDGAELTLTIEQEHQQINELFTQLEKHPPDSAEHRELWSRIVPLLREDVRDEEDVLFPKLAAALSTRQLAALGLAWEAVRRTAPTRAHPVVARRPPGNVLAAAPLTTIDRLRDRLDGAARSGSGTPAVVAERLSGGLARTAGVIEHAPPLTRGEDPSTEASR
ncbi:hemerythrin domain-containing protein [Mycobacterium sp. C3-094]